MVDVSSSRTASSHRFHVAGLALTLTAALLGAARPTSAQSAEARVVITSAKSFEQVSRAGKSLVAKNGMMVMAEVDQGKMLSMTGLKLKSTLFLVGNPTVGKQLFEQDQAVGLYMPLRVVRARAFWRFRSGGFRLPLLEWGRVRGDPGGAVQVGGGSTRGSLWTGDRTGLPGKSGRPVTGRGVLRPRLRLAVRRDGPDGTCGVRRAPGGDAGIADESGRSPQAMARSKRPLQRSWAFHARLHLTFDAGLAAHAAGSLPKWRVLQAR